jgi:hypothetical protein
MYSTSYATGIEDPLFLFHGNVDYNRISSYGTSENMCSIRTAELRGPQRMYKL